MRECRMKYDRFLLLLRQRHWIVAPERDNNSVREVRAGIIALSPFVYTDQINLA